MAVVLHIGLPKTGSSYLQEWLKVNHDILLGSGLNVISPPSARRLGVEALEDSADVERSDVRAIRDTHSLSDAVVEIQSVGSEAVIASEYLSLSHPKRLAEILAAAHIAVSGIICYLRRQDHICASGYAQAIKCDGHSERIGKARYTDRLNWLLLYETWQGAFPHSTMRIRNYEKCRAEGSLLRSFKEALGVNGLPTIDTTQYVNLSLSAEMTEVARTLNERGKVFDPACLLQIQSRRAFCPYGFSRKTTHEFEELFIESNRKLAGRFPEEFSEYAEPAWLPKGEDMTDCLSPESMAEILMEYVSIAGTPTARI